MSVDEKTGAFRPTTEHSFTIPRIQNDDARRTDLMPVVIPITRMTPLGIEKSQAIPPQSEQPASSKSEVA
jgi:hypothetical protein